MATKLNRRKTPLKSSEDEDPQTPSKVACRSLRRSKSRENADSANDSTPTKKAVTTSPSNRSLSRSKSRENVDSAKDFTPTKKATTSRPSNRSLSRSKSRENVDSAKDFTPTKKATTSRPSNRSLSRSKSRENVDSADDSTSTKKATTARRYTRSQSRENDDTVNNVTPPPQDTRTRRSSRISAKRPKLKTIDDSVDDSCDVESNDDGWQYDVPTKNFFNENPDDHVVRHSFKTPKKKDAMVALAFNTPKRIIELKSFGTPKTPRTPKTPKTPKGANTPKTPKTPKSSRKIIEPKTPSNLRAKLQKGLRKRCKDDDEEEEEYLDFEDSGDDYEPSESSDSDVEVDVTGDIASSCSSEDESNEVKRLVKPVHETLPGRTTRFSTRKQQDFVFESDKYFGQTNRKNATSDNTLDRLKTPRLQHEDMFKLLASHEISKNHQNCMRDLQSHYETFFPKWMFILREGFSILLHGLGSKRNILERLHRKVLLHENVLVVNGYFPSLTIKDILDDIVTGLLETSCKSKNLHEIVDAIEEEMDQTPHYHIFLIIHNIDGTMLRTDMAQNILSRLAHIQNVHLIASIDHINAPNLWDNIQLSNYNFSWWDATSFLPYTDETSVAENSMLLKNSGALTIASMKSVLLSLTQNARGIYMLIVENQLASNKTTNYQGMPFKNLYKKCLEAFLVSSDIVLRTQLTEFCDHNLLKLKRTADGTEQAKIPIDNILLQQFVEQYSNWQLEN